MRNGPLAGIRVVELAGLAPAPFAGTVLADLGADVVRVDRARPGADVITFPNDPLTRSRRWIGVDVKAPEGLELVLKLADDGAARRCKKADAAGQPARRLRRRRADARHGRAGRVGGTPALRARSGRRRVH